MLSPGQRIAMYNQVQVLDQKVSQLENQMSILQEELAGLTNERASLVSQLAPIWTVPPEILSYIFELAHREELKIPEKPYHRSCCPTASFPIKISDVSQLFQDIAVNTPTLWTVIHVHGAHEWRLDHIKTYLKHSKRLPLSVLLHVFGPQYPEPSIIAQMMTLIQANLYRLRQLEVMFDSHHISGLLAMRPLNQPAPQLTVLHLLDITIPPLEDIFNRVANNPDPPGPTLFGNEINKVTELRLSMVSVSWSQCNFKNLVIFNLNGYTGTLSLPYHEFWAIIENSPSLRELSLEDSEFLPSDPGPDTSEPCIGNSLEELRLSGLSPNISFLLLIRLHAPNLQDLKLLHIKEVDDLLDLVAEPPLPFPNLTSLQINGVFAGRREAIVHRLHQAYPRLQGWELSLKPFGAISLFADQT